MMEGKIWWIYVLVQMRRQSTRHRLVKLKRAVWGAEG
jgi:hypothetical protein